MNQLIIIVLLLTAALSGCAQQEAPILPVVAQQKPAPEKVYTYVEQMPQLPGGGGERAIVNEFFKNFHPSAAAVRGERQRPIIHFEVGPDGLVRRVSMHTSSNSANFDSAMIAAVHAFPRFIPGRQNGKAVAVSFNLPISCYKPQ
jgi:TonB family protein